MLLLPAYTPYPEDEVGGMPFSAVARLDDMVVQTDMAAFVQALLCQGQPEEECARRTIAWFLRCQRVFPEQVQLFMSPRSTADSGEHLGRVAFRCRPFLRWLDRKPQHAFLLGRQGEQEDALDGLEEVLIGGHDECLCVSTQETWRFSRPVFAPGTYADEIEQAQMAYLHSPKGPVLVGALDIWNPDMKRDDTPGVLGAGHRTWEGDILPFLDTLGREDRSAFLRAMAHDTVDDPIFRRWLGEWGISEGWVVQQQSLTAYPPSGMRIDRKQALVDAGCLDQQTPGAAAASRPRI